MNHNFDEQIAERVTKRTQLQDVITLYNTKNDEARLEIGKREARLTVLHQLKEANDKLLADYTYLSHGPNEERSGAIKFGAEKLSELEDTLKQMIQVTQ